MAEYSVKFDNADKPVTVLSGSLITDAARLAGISINQPCGGQGRCGRCTVQVVTGAVRRRSALRLLQTDLDKGYALACQTVIESDILVDIPPQEAIERRLSTDRVVSEIQVPEDYTFELKQSVRRYFLTLSPPSMEDQADDASRIRKAFRQLYRIENINLSLPVLRKISNSLREGNWEVTVILETYRYKERIPQYRVIDIYPGLIPKETPLWGAAIDVGTTTVTLWLVNLLTGKIEAQVSEYNGQITRGEDVISRIVYADKQNGSEELQVLVLDTIHQLLERACKRVKGIQVNPGDILKVTIAGNSVMMHLLLGIPSKNIRLTPFITAVNQFPILEAKEIGIKIHPEATVLCLPCVASYMGSDITAGVYSSGLDKTAKLSLFMDVGTNGEIVLGSQDWLVSCACSAGPAFEGAGVTCGMRATTGAIEEVWINGNNFEPTYRVIGGGKPRGICGSGLISLLAEMFMTGIVDKAGNIDQTKPSNRIRNSELGVEYILAWANETETGREIFISHVDIDNLLRAKGAIYAGYQVLANSVGVSLGSIEQMLIGGSFGKYINIEKAIEIGLLPDMEWDRFNFLGNTSIKGAYYALLDDQALENILEVASRMTYIELSADNSFYEAFMSALFLPHTDLNLFPSVNANKLNSF